MGAVLLAELALVAAGVAPPPVTKRMLVNDDDPTTRFMCYPSNPHGEFRPLPDLRSGNWRMFKILDPPVEVALENAHETPWCVAYSTHSPGLRGGAVEEAPQPGVVRVLGIGDSFAYGDGVADDQTLFAHLEARIGDGFEFLNGGQTGADLDINVTRLEQGAAIYAPTRALFVFIPNDIGLTPELRDRRSRVYDLINVRTERSEASSSGFVTASRLAHLVHRALSMRQMTKETLALYRDAYDPAVNGANLDAARDRLRRVAALPDVRTAVVIYPLMYGLDDGYPLAHVHEAVAAMARDAGLPVLDLAPAFAGRDPDELRVHPLDHHPNGAAHAIAADAVARWLREDVPGFLEPE